MVADIEELENLDTSEIHPRRLDAKGVLVPKNGEYFIFTIQDGTVKWYGRIRFSEKSTSIQDYLERAKTITMLFEEESDGSPPSDTLADEKLSIAGNYIYRHHVEPRSFYSFCADRRIHSQHHSKTLMFSGGRILRWMCCWKAVLTIIGTRMVTGIYPTFGPVSRSSQYRMKILQTDTRGPVSDQQKC